MSKMKDGSSYSMEAEIKELSAEIERLRALNAELLAALKACVSDLGGGNPELNWPSLKPARATIAKAEEK